MAAISRRGLPETLAVILAVVSATLMVAAFLIFLGYQFTEIGSLLPQHRDNVMGKIDSLLDTGSDNPALARIQLMVAEIAGRLEPIPDPSALPGDIPQVEVVDRTSFRDWITTVILPALYPVATFGLVAVIVFFMLLERAALRDRLVRLIGSTNIAGTSFLLAEAGERVSDYLLAQLILNTIYAVPIWLGLWLIGVPNALFFGLVTLVLRFVPYFGSAISALLPLTMAFAVSPGWSLVIATGLLFLVVEFVTSNFIEPWFYGRRTGLSPLAVVLSAFFWTWLWGPLGLIMATPLTVCLVVVGNHVPRLRIFAVLLGDQPALAGSARLYDRFLSGNALAFVEAAPADPARRALADFYDQVAIPALARAQADNQAGLLSDQDCADLAEAARQFAEALEARAEAEPAAQGPDAGEERPALGAASGPGGTDDAATALPDATGQRVAVVGAQTALENAAAALVAQLMRQQGAEAVALPHWATPSGSVGASFDAILLLSLDPPLAARPLQQLRRTRQAHPGSRLGLVLWTEPDRSQRPGRDEGRLGPALPAAVADFVAYGIDDAFAALFRPAAEDSEAAPVTARRARGP